VSFKDWVMMTLAILAFVLSLGTVYFNILRTDDVRVVLDRPPKVTLDERTGALNVGKRHGTITVINAGNRSSAITSIGLFVSQPRSRKDVCELGRRDRVENFEIEPFVIKPGEFAVKSLNFAWQEGSFGIAEKGRTNPEYVSIGACLVFNIATPDHYASTIKVPLYTNQWPRRLINYEDERDLRAIEPVLLYRPNLPLSVLKHSSLPIGN
jgi:hypothetical protein